MRVASLHRVTHTRLLRASSLAALLAACGATPSSPAPRTATQPVEGAQKRGEKPREAKSPHASLAASTVTLFVLHEFWTGETVASMEGSGSGFVVDVEGERMIATAAHVVDGATEIELFHASGFRAPITRMAALDRDADLALLVADELPEDALAVPLSEGTPSLADEVALISSPLGLDATLSFGTISGFRPELHAFQLAAGVSPGSSGGLVADESGRVVGVIRAKAPVFTGGENITLITPARDLVSLFERRDGAPLLGHPDPKRMTAIRRDSVTTSEGSPFESRKAAAVVELPAFDASAHYCASVDAPTATVALGEGDRPVPAVRWRVGKGRACATIAGDTPVAVWIGSDVTDETMAVTVERQP